MAGPLTRDERRTLLELARAAIVDRLRGDGSLRRAREGALRTPALKEPRGAFVTLHVAAEAGGRRLRGCIGTIEAREALVLNVIHNAVHAAFDDPRFAPLEGRELPTLSVEISALTPLRAVGGPEDVVAGQDGVVLRHGARSAVFLPQVATEQGWGVETLLENLALKAGLRGDQWRESTLRVFQAEVFGDGPARWL
jgi:AmmeMemoRadiSam system protein A